MSPVSTALSLTQVGVRQQICAECDRRTSSAETAECARETACSVFLLLPRICDLIARYHTEPPCGFGMAVRTLLRHAEDSQAISDAGAASPLDRHAEATVSVAQQVMSLLRSDRQAS
ncbi:hypothetical protein [Humisphaera borealis]|uniref:Uncharacterized protein n=1 Tax=Humisphaera borealis TaxID=2807512 RepID=A0A7M2WU32_9BACT|nr:hypothetical protein [Humisphaera borealis]QOV88963.1 hypothetical protein IPV69_22480 [Humisphaera borealis]